MYTADGEREKPSSLHKYQYGGQNPVNTSDPTGNETIDLLSIVGDFYRDSSSVGNSFDSGIRKRFDPDKRIDVRLSGGEYTLQDEAAKDALLLWVLDKSISIDEEFSGVIVWTQSRFRYSYPEEGFRLRGGGKGSYPAKYFILGAGMKLAAAYHTHGNFSNPEQTGLDEGSSKFSEDDKKRAAEMPKPFSLYLGTPNGEVKRFDPDTDQNGKGKTWVIFSKKRDPQEITER